MKLKVLFAGLLLTGSMTVASANDKFELTISNHVFTPTELTIPANKKVTLVIHNKDNSFEEFHSDSLHREKVIGANQSGVVNIGPLKPGVYTFMGEFHASTAQGRIVAK